MTVATWYDREKNYKQLPGYSYSGGAGLKTAINSAGELVGPFANNDPGFTDLGLGIWEARTNKCANYNINPTSLVNLNGVGLTITTIDDAAVLEDSGLSVLGPNVLQVYNPTGGRLYVTIGGTTGNTNPHCAKIYARGGTGVFNIDNYVTPVTINKSAQYTLYSLNNIVPANSTRALVIGVDAGQTLYLIGNQLEEGAFPTPLIPVTGAPATRTADNMFIQGITGLTEFTIFVEVMGDEQTSLWPNVITLGDGTVNNRIIIYLTSTSASSYAAGRVDVGGVVVGSIGATNSGTPLGNVKKIAMRVKLNDLGICVNSGAVVIDTSCTVPTMLARIAVGRYEDAAINYLNGVIRKFAIYHYAMTDAELQAITKVSMPLSLDFTL